MSDSLSIEVILIWVNKYSNYSQYLMIAQWIMSFGYFFFLLLEMEISTTDINDIAKKCVVYVRKAVKV